MNFLAHFYLSDAAPELHFGNYIADGIKGGSIELFDEDTIRGIQFHRWIDQYTDSHPIFRNTIEELRPHFEKYAPVVADIYYDYFLGKDWVKHHQSELQLFSDGIYHILNERVYEMPEKSQFFYHYMRQNNILFQYSTHKGIEKVLKGMSGRASFASGMEKGLLVLKEKESILQSQFDDFFTDIKKEAVVYLEER